MLHLASPLEYKATATTVPSPPFPAVADLLFAYPEDSFPRHGCGNPDPAQAARLSPLFSGAATALPQPGPGFFSLEAGDFYFSQWEAGEFAGDLEGLDAFAMAVESEAVSQGRKAEGPWMLRVLVEEEGTRFQGLRRISARA